VADHVEDHDSDPEANLPFLFAVYIITWGGFFAYAFAMSRRQREVQRELDALRSVIAEKESQSRDAQA
jgi:CcmD family protein